VSLNHEANYEQRAAIASNNMWSPGHSLDFNNSMDPFLQFDQQLQIPMITIKAASQKSSQLNNFNQIIPTLRFNSTEVQTTSKYEQIQNIPLLEQTKREYYQSLSERLDLNRNDVHIQLKNEVMEVKDTLNFITDILLDYMKKRDNHSSPDRNNSR
jgi:hypothetical protein